MNLLDKDGDTKHRFACTHILSYRLDTQISNETKFNGSESIIN